MHALEMNIIAVMKNVKCIMLLFWTCELNDNGFFCAGHYAIEISDRCY